MPEQKKSPISQLRSLSRQKITLRILLIAVAVIAVMMILGYIATDCGICSYGCMSGAEACISCAQGCADCASCLCS